MEVVASIIIALLGAGGGVVVLVRAVLDYKQDRASKEYDADDRLMSRIEKLLDDERKESQRLACELVTERAYNTSLAYLLSINGIVVPERKY